MLTKRICNDMKKERMVLGAMKYCCGTITLLKLIMTQFYSLYFHKSEACAIAIVLIKKKKMQSCLLSKSVYAIVVAIVTVQFH